jgi:hypothetical protein
MAVMNENGNPRILIAESIARKSEEIDSELAYCFDRVYQSKFWLVI